MPLEVKQLHCPNCGGGLEVKNAQRAKSIVCQSCGSQIDLARPEYGIIGRSILNSAPPRTPIELGMWGEFDGQRYQAIGRVRYREEEYMWDEWLLMTEDGQFKWLTEGEKGFTLYESFVPRNPVDPVSVRDSVNLEGTSAEVGDKGVGRIDYLEGELTWRATVGDEVNYLDAEFPGGRYSIEWTPDEVEFFRGKNLSDNEVRRAFGLPEVATPSILEKLRAALTVRTAVIVAVVLVIVCVCCVAAAVAPSSTSSSSFGMPSIRTSSSGGSSFSGGGSSGGGGK